MKCTRRTFLWLVVAALTVPAASVAAAATEPSEKPRPLRVLFIGNSYTAYNGTVPKVVKQLADHAKRPLDVERSVSGGKSLEWHWNEGDARPAIEKGKWDYVVLQDHSLQAIDKPELLAEYARKFDELIKKQGARTLFYLTWARQHQPEKQAVITKAYVNAARELSASVAPVGIAWQRVLRERPDVVLHFDDRSHPNVAGTYLTACVFYAALFDEPPPNLVPKISNQRTGDPEQVPAELATYLRTVAFEVVRSPGTWANSAPATAPKISPTTAPPTSPAPATHPR